MRTLLLLSGLPGSGKSTWSRQYKRLHPTAKIVSSDEIRKEFFGTTANFSDEKRVWGTFLDRLKRFGQEEGAIVIADSTNLNNYYRRYYVESTPEYDHHVLVMFDIPAEDCELLNNRRIGDRRLPIEAMRKLESQFEPVDEEVEKLFNEVVHVGPDFVCEALQKAK